MAPLVSVIVLQARLASNAIVSPLTAEATASRSEPAPASSQLETVSVEAIAGCVARTAARQSASERRRSRMPARGQDGAIVIGVLVLGGGSRRRREARR